MVEAFRQARLGIWRRPSGISPPNQMFHRFLLRDSSYLVAVGFLGRFPIGAEAFLAVFAPQDAARDGDTWFLNRPGYGFALQVAAIRPGDSIWPSCFLSWLGSQSCSL